MVLVLIASFIYSFLEGLAPSAVTQSFLEKTLQFRNVLCYLNVELSECGYVCLVPVAVPKSAFSIYLFKSFIFHSSPSFMQVLTAANT